MSVDTMPTDDYVLYADTKKSLNGLNKRMLFLLLPLVVLSFVFCGVFAHGFSIPQHGPAGRPAAALRVSFNPVMTNYFTWFPWLLLAECGFLYVVMARSHRKQTKPIVVLNSEGIAVDTAATHIGLVRWDEIEEVRPYTLIYRYVGIIPKNTNALCRRLGGKRSWIVKLNAALIPPYKLLGIFVAPINIPQVYLPVTADELTARIHTYQAAYARQAFDARQASLSPGDGSVWPPPPTREAQP